MGLDIGDRRIGIALSDEEGRIASPKDTIERNGMDKDVDRLIAMAKDEGVGEILVGLPLSLDGSEGPQARKVMKFVHRLSERADIPVVPWDERLTTVAAERVLLEADLSRRRRRHLIDKVAAAFMLQSYLDYRNRKLSAESRAG